MYETPSYKKKVLKKGPLIIQNGENGKYITSQKTTNEYRERWPIGCPQTDRTSADVQNKTVTLKIQKHNKYIVSKRNIQILSNGLIHILD